MGKHIEMKYHLILERVMRGSVFMEKISGAENLMNPFTKTLSSRVIDGHKDNIGCWDRALKSKIWCNKVRFEFLLIYPLYALILI